MKEIERDGGLCHNGFSGFSWMTKAVVAYEEIKEKKVNKNKQ